jgi:hypothetical protein
LPTGSGMSLARGWVRPVPMGALRSCVVMMVSISASWWYSLSTPSAEGGGSAFRSMAAVASIWQLPPLTVRGGSNSVGLTLGGSKVHH